MGGCWGRCMQLKTDRLRQCDSEQDFVFLIDEKLQMAPENKRSFLSRLFKKRKHKLTKKPVLQLVDDLINPQSYNRLKESQRLPSTSTCSHDIPLQCLDARALISRTNMSTPVSSLDLEWEHETLPISMVHDPSGSSWTALALDELPPGAVTCSERTASRHSNDSTYIDVTATRHHHHHNNNSDDNDNWSHLSSSANSLEWDNNTPVAIAATELVTTVSMSCYDSGDDIDMSVGVGSVTEGLPSGGGEETVTGRGRSQTEIDAETLQLLSEIERLTSQTLEETGRDLYDS